MIMYSTWLFYVVLSVVTLAAIAIGLSLAWLFVTKGRR